MTRGGGGLCNFWTLPARKIQRAGGAARLLCNYPAGPGAILCGWQECLLLIPSFFFSLPPSLPTHAHTDQLRAMCLQYGRSPRRSPCLPTSEGQRATSAGNVLSLSFPFLTLSLFCTCAMEPVHLQSNLDVSPRSAGLIINAAETFETVGCFYLSFFALLSLSVFHL